MKVWFADFESDENLICQLHQHLEQQWPQPPSKKNQITLLQENPHMINIEINKKHISLIDIR